MQGSIKRAPHGGIIQTTYAPIARMAAKPATGPAALEGAPAFEVADATAEVVLELLPAALFVVLVRANQSINCSSLTVVSRVAGR